MKKSSQLSNPSIATRKAVKDHWYQMLKVPMRKSYLSKNHILKKSKKQLMKEKPLKNLSSKVNQKNQKVKSQA